MMAALVPVPLLDLLVPFCFSFYILGFGLSNDHISAIFV
jgi:hypothetical protein